MQNVWRDDTGTGVEVFKLNALLSLPKPETMMTFITKTCCQHIRKCIENQYFANLPQGVTQGEQSWK